MAFNLADMIEHTIDAVPERIALESGDRVVTYAELEEQANRLAHHLQANGVQAGDKVGLYIRNSIECVVSMLAILKVRGVMVNVNYRYVEKELHYLFDNSDMVALIHERRYADKIAAVAPLCPKITAFVAVDDDSAASLDSFGGVLFEKALAAADPSRDFGERSSDDVYMLYTGGTTGMPKGVMWRHQDVWRVLGGGISIATGEEITDEFQQSREGAKAPQVTRFPVPPFIHGGSQWAALSGMLSGGKAVVYPDFGGAFTWEMIQKHRVNVLFIVGDAMARPMMDALLVGDYDTSSIKSLTSSAVQFSPGLKEQYVAMLPDVVIIDSIGSSETGFSGLSVIKAGAQSSAGPRVKIDASTQVLDTDGNPIAPGSDEIGMLARSGHIPIGYYNDPVKTAETFKTLGGVRYSIPGDFARVEADGTVTMLGRGSVSINTGGEKVYPEEVEGALKSHPAVLDALVVGVPDARMGHAVAAVIALRPGMTATFDELDSHARQHISGYKAPRSVWLSETIERSPAGKPNYKWAVAQTQERPADLP